MGPFLQMNNGHFTHDFAGAGGEWVQPPNPLPNARIVYFMLCFSLPGRGCTSKRIPRHSPLKQLMGHPRVRGPRQSANHLGKETERAKKAPGAKCTAGESLGGFCISGALGIKSERKNFSAVLHLMLL
uniref:Uncharacterized protein n=1 Tax=Sphaerodactylus townsendi TaxID=933632 RepID=A0ACB8EYM6_9SAUR